MTLHSNYNKDLKVSVFYCDEDDEVLFMDHEGPLHEITRMSIKETVEMIEKKKDQFGEGGDSLVCVLCTGKMINPAPVVELIMKTRASQN